MSPPFHLNSWNFYLEKLFHRSEIPLKNFSASSKILGFAAPQGFLRADSTLENKELFRNRRKIVSKRFSTFFGINYAPLPCKSLYVHIERHCFFGILKINHYIKSLK